MGVWSRVLVATPGTDPTAKHISNPKKFEKEERCYLINGSFIVPLALPLCSFDEVGGHHNGLAARFPDHTRKTRHSLRHGA